MIDGRRIPSVYQPEVAAVRNDLSAFPQLSG
jgi:hypothetical protein